jgi:1-deoxy-D-xylulose-5-phosphate synthase
VRYPRGTGPNARIEKTLSTLPIGKARLLIDKPKSEVAILSFGALLADAREAAESLGATLVDMRWVKPLDATLVRQLARRHSLLVTVEDHQRMTGAGSAVGELLHAEGLKADLLSLGLDDHFVHHGKRELLLAEAGLDAAGIERAIQDRLLSLRAQANHF